ncbi:MAG: hypothetical protein ABWY93_32290 [Mycobacterium sp.]
MSSSEWLSSAAFCISVTALLSNMMLLWLKWPRIIVEVAIRKGSAPQTDSYHVDVYGEDNIVLTVINNGSEAITLKSVGLTSPSRASRHRLDYLDTWHTSQTPLLPTAHGAQQPPVMPLRIDGHACAVFEYSHEAMAQLPAGLAYRGYAKRYRAMRWLPNHPLLRETISRRSVTRRTTGLHPSVVTCGVATLPVNHQIHCTTVHHSTSN